MKFFLYCLFILFFIFTNSFAEANVSFEITPSQNSIRVGDTLLLTMKSSHSEGIDVRLKSLDFAPFEIIDRWTDNSSQTSKWLFILSCYSLGKHNVPPQKLYYTGPAGETGVLTSETIPVEVVHLLPESAGPERLNPFQKLLTFNKTLSLKKMLVVLLVICFLAGGGYVFYRYWKKQRPSDLPGKKKYSIPPHTRALTEIDRIEKLDLPSQGLIQEYYFRLTEVIKVYLKEIFSINILESTTEEIRDIFQTQGKSFLDEGAQNDILSYLEEADFAKFANWKPGDEELRRALTHSRRIINSVHDFLQSGKDWSERVISETSGEKENAS